MKTGNPNLTYLLDRKYFFPAQVSYQAHYCLAVLGDSGRLYVAPDVIPIYRALLPHATIITPNWFEIEYDFTLVTPIRSSSINFLGLLRA